MPDESPDPEVTFVPVDVPPAVDYTDAPEPEAAQEPDIDDPPSNLDDQGRAHFAVLYPDGDQRCGGCNAAWPCDQAKRLLALPVEPAE